MRFAFPILIVALTLSASTVHATTLPPEFKAYDFAEAYYIEDGGVVISPYSHGFFCKDGIQTPEGIRIMPGKTFAQFDESRMVVDIYKLLYLNKEGTRAYFQQETYLYKVVKDKDGKYHDEIREHVASSKFYLTKFRMFEIVDHDVPYVEVPPTTRAWCPRPQYYKY